MYNVTAHFITVIYPRENSLDIKAQVLLLKETCLHLVISDTEFLDFLESVYHNYGFITPNASPIEIHVNCSNSTGQFDFFLPFQSCSAAYIMIKPGLCFFKKQVRCGFDTQTNFELACKNVTTVQIRLKFIPSFTDQTHILLTHGLPDYHETVIS